MTEAQAITINIEEINDLVTRLQSHAATSKMTGYFEAAYDIMQACQKLGNLSTLLKSNAEKESQ